LVRFTGKLQFSVKAHGKFSMRFFTSDFNIITAIFRTKLIS